MFRKRGEGLVKPPADTPVIYQMARGPFAPSQSPFPVKLETFCRLAKIPYMVDATGRFSSRDKIPWMMYNGEVVEDSQMCLEYLREKLGVDLNNHLDDQQKATAHMIRVMVEEHLYWASVVFRWLYPTRAFEDYLKGNGMSTIKLWFVKRHLRNEAIGQGLGRHSAEEVQKILMDDLTTLSNYLGEKPYMLGDRPCEADCSVFGLLAQYLYHHFGHEVVHGTLEKHFLNLHQYVLRMKEDLWPDWDECCKQPPADKIYNSRLT